MTNLFSLIFLSATLATPVFQTPPQAPVIIQAEIIRQAQEYGVPVEEALDIAFCESSFNPNAKNPNSSAVGLYQFLSGTFLEGVKKRNLDWTLDDRYDPKKNIDMAMWMMSRGEYWRWKDCLPK